VETIRRNSKMRASKKKRLFDAADARDVKQVNPLQVAPARVDSE